jgi:hypothetical protein
MPRPGGWRAGGLVAALLALLLATTTTALAATSVVVVKPSALNGWGLTHESTAGATGSFVNGPGTPLFGAGSLRMTTSNGNQGFLAATQAQAGTRLDAIKGLEYRTYRTAGGAAEALALQIGITSDVNNNSLGFQGRLVFEPYHSATVATGAWQTWDTLTTAGTGQWWGTGAPFNGPCPMANPCTWAQVLAAFPNAGIHTAAKGGFIGFKAGSGWASFDGNVDGLVININGTTTIYDFEPEPQCSTTCYVDGANGNDSNGGSTVADAKKTIQAAIDAVSPGGTVRVLPGTYSETAAGRTLSSIGGTYQFGLFFADAKSGVTLQGVTAADVPITSAAAAAATINTNATNNFGPSGIFVEGDNVTIAGVIIGSNTTPPNPNKTVEVIGDAFTLKNSRVIDPQGSIYINDFRFNSGTNTSHVKAYRIEGNDFGDTSLDITSGAGHSGPVSGRVITGNTFTNGQDYPSISFNGTGGPPWFTHPVGGAQITGNTFTNTGAQGQHIRARGTYDNSQFDWASYWTNNTFNKAVVVGPTPPAVPRAYSYTSGPYTFTNVRRIGATIQGEVANGTAGDTVLIKAGTYPEAVTLDKALTIQGAGVGSTIIQGTCAAPGILFSGSLSNVTIADLTITGALDGIQTGNIGHTLTNLLIEDVAATGNCRHGIFSQDGTVNGYVVRRVTASNNGGSSNPDGNTGRGILITNGDKSNVTIEDGTFNNNQLVGIDLGDGRVTGLLISGNTVVGNGDSGIGVLGPQGPGANLIDDNTVTNNGRFGIEIKVPTGNGATSGAGSVVVSNNVVSRTIAATDARDYAGIAVFKRSGGPMNAAQPSGVAVINNEVSGFRRKPSGSTGDGFGIVVEGTGMTVQNNLVTNNDVGIQAQAGNTANTQNTIFFDRGDASAYSGTITRNSVAGNDIGVRNAGVAGAIAAEENWWGSASGPTHASNPGGTGVPVSNDVDFTPWLCDGTDTSAAVGFQPTTALCPQDDTGTITARVFNDSNKSGTREGSEANQAGLTVYVDLDNSGTLTGGDLFASSTGAAGVDNLTIANVPAGQRVVCQEVGGSRFHTTGRCVVVEVPAGGTASSQTDPGLLFGSAARSGCGTGVLINNVRAISLDGGASYFRPTNITGPAAAPHLNTRMAFSGSNPVTNLRQGEYVSNGLLISGVSTTAHANLVLKFNYNTGKQSMAPVAENPVVAADGTVATYLGSGASLPSPLPAPGTFSWFDRNGEVFIFNVPTTADGALYQDVYAITTVTASNSNQTIKTTGSIAGKISGGALVTISNTCGDAADSRTFSSPATTNVIDTNLVVDDVIDRPI